MPTDTQRAPTREELEAVGPDIHTLALKFGNTARVEGHARDEFNALIIAIAKRVREEGADGAAVALGKDAEAVALAEFMDYVATNYAPGTIIANPQWHAPRLFRAALHALRQEAPHA